MGGTQVGFMAPSIHRRAAVVKGTHGSSVRNVERAMRAGSACPVTACNRADAGTPVHRVPANCRPGIRCAGTVRTPAPAIGPPLRHRPLRRARIPAQSRFPPRVGYRHLPRSRQTVRGCSVLSPVSPCPCSTPPIDVPTPCAQHDTDRLATQLSESHRTKVLGAHRGHPAQAGASARRSPSATRSAAEFAAPPAAPAPGCAPCGRPRRPGLPRNDQGVLLPSCRGNRWRPT